METVEPHKSPNECRNAREYLISRLRNDDGPIKPSVVADDYGCGAGHVRNVLVDLVDEGVATRVGRGRYVATESAYRYDQSQRGTVSGERQGNGTDNDSRRASQHGCGPHRRHDSLSQSHLHRVKDRGPTVRYHRSRSEGYEMKPSPENVTGQVVRQHTFDHQVRWDYVIICGTVILVLYALSRAMSDRDREDSDTSNTVSGSIQNDVSHKSERTLGERGFASVE